jgi:hypothetical protein
MVAGRATVHSERTGAERAAKRSSRALRVSVEAFPGASGEGKNVSHRGWFAVWNTLGRRNRFGNQLGRSKPAIESQPSEGARRVKGFVEWHIAERMDRLGRRSLFANRASTQTSGVVV